MYLQGIKLQMMHGFFENLSFTLQISSFIYQKEKLNVNNAMQIVTFAIIKCIIFYFIRQR